MRENDKFFITGTTTDVGKTVVSATLCKGFANSGGVTYWKPVQTGGLSLDRDTVSCLCRSKNLRTRPELNSYPAPLSPNQAARLAEMPQVNLELLVQEVSRLSAETPWVIEGAGGVEVPLNDEYETWLDFASVSQIPTFVVASSELGTLNQTALTLDALARRGANFAGAIVFGPQNSMNVNDLQLMFHKKYNRDLHIFSFVWEQNEDIQAKIETYADKLRDFCVKIVTDQKNEKLRTIAQVKELDQKLNWHPYTQHLTEEKPLLIQRAQGVWLYGENNERYLDGISSWWVNTIGHGRPEIQLAIAQQQARLDHVVFAGATHEPAAALAGRINELTEGELSRVFFSDNGSTAVEVALKMAYQSWQFAGQNQKQKFLALEGSYHGDTFGAMAVAGSRNFHGTFEPLLFEGLYVRPVLSHPSSKGRYEDFGAQDSIKNLRNLLEQNHKQIAAAIIEPLVQGAGGMLMHNPSWLKLFVQTLREFDIPVIFDEVFTGLGRVGADFAYKRLGIVPDILCLAKGLTGGTLPLALTVAKEKYFEKFLHEDKSKSLLHGHSYTANAISCAAALAALRIYEKENLSKRALDMESVYNAWLAQNAPRLGLRAPRALGGILAFELPGTNLDDYFAKDSRRFIRQALDSGLFLRPLGNTIYFAPPLTITGAELEFALNVLGTSLESALPPKFN